MNFMGQTYQELSDIVKKDLMKLKKSGINNLDEINFQDFFYIRKRTNPRRYERVRFDTNGHKPYSEDLEQIRSSLVTSGFLKYSLVIVGE